MNSTKRLKRLSVPRKMLPASRARWALEMTMIRTTKAKVVALVSHSKNSLC